jgi:hypothetical protein
MRVRNPETGEDRPDAGKAVDPTSASPAELETYICNLEQACAAEPQSADLRTCLGLAYAARRQFGRARRAFERALESVPTHFFARLRYAELLQGRGFLRLARRQATLAAESARTRAESAMAGRLLRVLREMKEPPARR